MSALRQKTAGAAAVTAGAEVDDLDKGPRESWNRGVQGDDIPGLFTFGGIFEDDVTREVKQKEHRPEELGVVVAAQTRRRKITSARRSPSWRRCVCKIRCKRDSEKKFVDDLFTLSA